MWRMAIPDFMTKGVSMISKADANAQRDSAWAAFRPR
jgi:hypothetical protein